MASYCLLTRISLTKVVSIIDIKQASFPSMIKDMCTHFQSAEQPLMAFGGSQMKKDRPIFIRHALPYTVAAVATNVMYHTNSKRLRYVIYIPCYL